MPDTLTPQELHEISESYALTTAELKAQRRKLLAHIDALTAEHDACVEKVGHSLTCPRGEQ